MPEALNCIGKALKGDEDTLTDDGEAFESNAKALNDDGDALKRANEKR